MAKYHCSSVWFPMDTRGAHGTHLLKSILKVKKRFSEFIRFNLDSQLPTTKVAQWRIIMIRKGRGHGMLPKKEFK